MYTLFQSQCRFALDPLPSTVDPLVPPNLRDVEAVERVTKGDRHGDRRDGAHDDVINGIILIRHLELTLFPTMQHSLSMHSLHWLLSPPSPNPRNALTFAQQDFVHFWKSVNLRWRFLDDK